MATRMDLPIPAWANRSTPVHTLRNGTLKPHRKLSKKPGFAYKVKVKTDFMGSRSTLWANRQVWTNSLMPRLCPSLNL